MSAELLTLDEHLASYRRHKDRADELKVRIDLALLTGIDSHEHMDLVREYHDEVSCMTREFTLAAILDTVT